MVNTVGRNSHSALVEGLHFTLLALNIINVILHLIGAYILTIVYRNSSDQKVQQIFLINLSVTSCVTNFFEIIRIFPDLGLSDSPTWRIVNDCFLIISFSGFYIVLYANMFYITLDRLFDITLNIRYALYVREKRAKILLGVTWVIAILISGGEIIYYLHKRFSWSDLFFVYFYPPILLSYLVLAIVTYAVIFQSYRRSRQPPVPLPGRIIRKQSVIQVFRKSRFYISLLLIITFIVFMIIPDLTYIFMAILRNDHSDILITCFLICYALANLSDAFIYIYVQKKVRKTLWKRFLCSNRHTNTVRDVNPMSLIARYSSRVNSLKTSVKRRSKERSSANEVTSSGASECHEPEVRTDYEKPQVKEVFVVSRNFSPANCEIENFREEPKATIPDFTIVG